MRRRQNLVWANYFFEGFIQKFLKKHPLFVTFFVTSKCNARCKHCFYWKEASESKNELDLDEILRISRSMDNFPILLISGGEPFLREDLAGICKVFYVNNKVKEIRIPTNGMIPDTLEKTGNILENCPNSLVTIQLSIDGLYQHHDDIRGVNGAFKKLVDTSSRLYKLKKKFENLEISFNYTFSEYNQNYVKEVVNFLFENFKTRRLSMTLTRGDTREKFAKDISIEEYNKAIDQLNTMYEYNEERTTNQGYHETFPIRWNLMYNVVKKIHETKKRVTPCYAGILDVVINEVGDIYPCELSDKKFGSLREMEYDFKKIWNSHNAQVVRGWIAENKCFCTHETNIANNCRFSLGIYPFLIKEMLINKNAGSNFSSAKNGRI